MSCGTICTINTYQLCCNLRRDRHYGDSSEGSGIASGSAYDDDEANGSGDGSGVTAGPTTVAKTTKTSATPAPTTTPSHDDTTPAPTTLSVSTKPACDQPDTEFCGCTFTAVHCTNGIVGPTVQVGCPAMCGICAGPVNDGACPTRAPPSPPTDAPTDEPTNTSTTTTTTPTYNPKAWEAFSFKQVEDPATKSGGCVSTMALWKYSKLHVHTAPYPMWRCKKQCAETEHCTAVTYVSPFAVSPHTFAATPRCYATLPCSPQFSTHQVSLFNPPHTHTCNSFFSVLCASRYAERKLQSTVVCRVFFAPVTAAQGSGQCYVVENVPSHFQAPIDGFFAGSNLDMSTVETSLQILGIAIPLNSAEDCAMACMKHKKCAAFHYNGVQCGLKNAAPTEGSISATMNWQKKYKTYIRVNKLLGSE